MSAHDIVRCIVGEETELNAFHKSSLESVSFTLGPF